jgi:biotin carboxyl carrier protein
MHKVTVNNAIKFDIEREGDDLLINGNAANVDIKQLNAFAYHVLAEQKSYNAEVVSFNVAEKIAEINVNGNTYVVAVKDQFDLLLEQLGMADLNSVKVSEIKAPMPGLVLKVFVNEGDEVKKGDNLFTLEAMKMENIIKSPADVKVKTIKLSAGDKVEKGQVLMQFS